MAKKQPKSTGQSISRERQKAAAKAKRVEAQPQRGPKTASTDEAQGMKTHASGPHPWPSPRQPTESRDQYRFLNPYNFVRYLPEPNILPGDSDAQLLGRCPPPPHDRYVGLSGRITCRLTTVTPFFISDSHDVRVTKFSDEKGKEREHHSYRFFQVNGKDAIPATSLRGMIRSIFEAVTNSCYSVFEPERRLDYREVDVAQQMKAAIVTKLPDTEDDRGEVALCSDARLPAYLADGAENMIDATAWQCGEEAFTVVTQGKAPKVIEMVVRQRHVYASHPDGVTQGWVKITGQTIDGKKNERFFFYPQGQDKAPRAMFDWQRVLDYNTVLKEQIEDKTRQFATRYQHRELTVGDLVYVRLDKGEKQVLDISLVKVPRLRFRKPLAEFIPEHLHPCTDYDALCPACRVFGWVKAAHQRGRQSHDLSVRMAYAGRLRFSFAYLVEDKGVYDGDLPLAILSTPKPTTALFYLLKGDRAENGGEPPEGDQRAAYIDGYKLRGRKVYRHHGEQLNRQEFERTGKKQDDQNRTVRGVRAPGNEFEFAIDFENLAPVELGALLWILDLDGRGYHRLGYAKPLGFGSVQIGPPRVDLLSWNDRSQSLTNGGWHEAGIQETSRFVEMFALAMKRSYGLSLERLGNVQDLFALVSAPQTSLPIHYPRTRTTPDREGKNFEWFEENTRKAKENEEAGPHHALEMATDKVAGLPLLEPKTSETPKSRKRPTSNRASK